MKMLGLTARKVEGLKESGMYGDGGGLYLCVSDGGTKAWILRTTVYGRRRELGLGSAVLVTLAEAREEARRLRKVARAGGDPETVRNRETLTFAEAAKRVHEKLKHFAFDLVHRIKRKTHHTEWRECPGLPSI